MITNNSQLSLDGLNTVEGPNIITDNLKLYIDFANIYSYGSSVSNLYNATRDGIVFNNINTVAATGSNLGGGLFNGYSTYLSVTSSFSFTDFSIVFVLKSNATAPTFHRGILSLLGSGGTDFTGGGFALHQITAGALASGTGNYFGIESQTLFVGNTSRNNTNTQNNTYHGAIVCDQANSIIRYYYNGLPDGTQIVTGSQTYSPSVFSIMSRNISFLGGICNFHNGILYSMAFYDSALNDAQILQNFKAVRKRFNL
jgi:hypothetical protein